MSKRTSEGDVVFNRVAVGMAGESSLVASLLGPATEPDLRNGDLTQESDDNDLKGGNGDDEQFGVGAKVPKEIEDGSFTRRVPTSYGNLLQNLIGKKAAKAHMASKQASKSSLKQQTFSKPKTNATKEESEDEEEEGRASAFKSKRRKTEKPRSQPLAFHHDKDIDEVPKDTAENPSRGSSKNESQLQSGAGDELSTQIGRSRDGSDTEEKTSTPRPQKSKSTSYLDEILAERSKKKKTKQKKRDK